MFLFMFLTLAEDANFRFRRIYFSMFQFFLEVIIMLILLCNSIIKVEILSSGSNFFINSKLISHVFLFNIRNYSPEISNIQRRDTELNIVLSRVNKQKLAWNICFIIYPQHQIKSWVNANKAK